MIIDITSELFCVLFFTLSLIGYCIYKLKKWRIQYWIIPMLIFYFICLLSITIFPICIFDKETLNMIKEASGENYIFYQIIPFKSIRTYFTRETFIQLIGNLFLLSPIVIFVEIVTKGKHNSKLKIIFISLLSVVIEFLQLFINFTTGHPNRIADIDDLILNISGVFITFFIIKFLENNIKHRKKLYHRIWSVLYI